MAKKSKSAAPKLTISDIKQLNETVDEIARLEVQKRRLEADRDKAVQDVLAKHDLKIEEIAAQIKSLASMAGIYCKAMREAVFGKLKSAASALTRFGLRDGTPKLCLLSRKDTWEQVAEKLKEKHPGKFIRTVEEVDKEAIKAAKFSAAELAELGLRMDSTETFFVDPKSDDAERFTAEAEATA